MWRGVEQILLGHDARDAWAITQRICGVCTTVHAIASVRAVENALQMEVPLNAQYIRNLIITAHAIHDHIVHFYHLSALDWVDVTSALKGDPGQDCTAGGEPVELERQQPPGIHQGEGAPGRLRRYRPARHFHQRLLGPSGDETAARSEPAGSQRITCRRWKSSATPTRSSPSSAPRRRTSRTWRSAAFPIPITLDSPSVLTVERLYGDQGMRSTS